MLGSLAALWLSLGILVFGSIIAAGILIGKNAVGSAAGGTSGKILYVKLSGEITDRQSTPSLTELFSDGIDENDDMETIIQSLVKARDDSSVKGVFIECKGAIAGVATRTEIIEALKLFKESGKWVYAYSDNYMQGDYYVASVADKIYLNPVGSVTVKGLSASVMFYKDLLDKLGIDIQVVRVGSFKSAVEPFLRTDMSAESREQTEVFLTNIWHDVRNGIAGNRHLKSNVEVDMWADSLSFVWAPEKYVENRIVSELCYRSEVETELRKKMKIDSDDDLPYVTPGEYIAGETENLLGTSEPHIAVLYAIGDIVDSGEGGISSERYVPEIERLANDDNVKAMVLRVNSGGGSAFASEQIWKALEDFKAKGKTLYVSMGDYAASGGYYISCGADKIYSDASTLTGSIGIFGVIPSAGRLVKNIGVNIETVETNPGADFPTLTSPLTPAQYAGMQSYVERGYETFTSRVAEGRKLPVDSVKAIGGGRVWDGSSAQTLGLVDEIGSLRQAVADLNKSLDKKYKTVSYPIDEDNLWHNLIKEARKNVTVEIAGFGQVDAESCRKYVERVLYSSPVQARMEMIVIE